MKDAATVFRALSDGTRLRLLGLLGSREVCVCDLMSSLRLPQPTISRHLSYLKRAGLVADRRQGRWRYYSMKTSATRLGSVVKAAVAASVAADPGLRAARRRVKARICR